MPHSPHPEVQRFSAPSEPRRVAPGVERSDPAKVQRLAASTEPQRVTRQRATAVLRALAERQHGVVAWRQLVALGLTEGLIKSRVTDGQLIPLHRGVFALGHRRIGLYGEWLAATLACGPGAVLSHGSAAQLWGIRGSRKPIEVTRRLRASPAARRPPPPDQIASRRARHHRSRHSGHDDRANPPRYRRTPGRAAAGARSRRGRSEPSLALAEAMAGHHRAWPRPKRRQAPQARRRSGGSAIC